MLRDIDLFIEKSLNPAGQLLNLFTCYGLIIISKDCLDRCTALYKLFKGIVYLFINESVFIIRDVVFLKIRILFSNSQCV